MAPVSKHVRSGSSQQRGQIQQEVSWPLESGRDVRVKTVGMFYRQRMLVIDGKYSSDDGLSTTMMISNAVIIGEEQQP
jgi:hypothetical protein